MIDHQSSIQTLKEPALDIPGVLWSKHYAQAKWSSVSSEEMYDKTHWQRAHLKEEISWKCNCGTSFSKWSFLHTFRALSTLIKKSLLLEQNIHIKTLVNSNHTVIWNNLQAPRKAPYHFLFHPEINNTSRQTFHLCLAEQPCPIIILYGRYRTKLEIWGLMWGAECQNPSC